MMRVGTENDSNTTKMLRNSKTITSIEYSASLRQLTRSSNISSTLRGLEKHYVPRKISACIIRQNFELGALITFARYGRDTSIVCAIYYEHKTSGGTPI